MLLGRLLLLMLLPAGLKRLSCAGNLSPEGCQLLLCCLVRQACLLRCMLHIQKRSSLQPNGTTPWGKHHVLAHGVIDYHHMPLITGRNTGAARLPCNHASCTNRVLHKSPIPWHMGATKLVSALVHTYLVGMLGFTGRHFLPPLVQRLIYLLSCALLPLQFLRSETRTWTQRRVKQSSKVPVAPFKVPKEELLVLLASLR